MRVIDRVQLAGTSRSCYHENSTGKGTGMTPRRSGRRMRTYGAEELLSGSCDSYEERELNERCQERNQVMVEGEDFRRHNGLACYSV